MDEDRREHQVKSYHLQEHIGEGTLGVVYRATQEGIAREVAIKLIRPAYANQPAFVRRFDAEAQIIARLEHPHIVPLYDYWRDPSGAYLVMRYIRNGSLLDAAQAGPLPLTTAVRMLEQVGSALTLAHQQGVIHRDVKPANILRDEADNFYLADFGIATVNPVDGGKILGPAGSSPSYLAPEQIKGEPVGPQTDIYNLGLLLYEVLGGLPPFQGATPEELLHQQLYSPLPPLGAQRPELPFELAAVLERATAKVREERYPDVATFVDDFRRAAGATVFSESELRQLPTGTVTFLFSDIEGSTRRWERAPAAMADAVARHDAVLRTAFATHHGRIFGTAGDSYAVAFASAQDALAAALAAQRDLAAVPWPAEVSPILVRMALSSGQAAIREGMYYAQYTLNRLARLLSAGYGGQILASASAFAHLEKELPAGVALRGLGTHRLKDLADPMPIYQVIVPDLPAVFPPLKTLDAPPATLLAEELPEPINPYKGLRAFQEADSADFFGRAALTERLLARLAAPDAAGRFLAVVGPSGSGKSSVVRAGLVPAVRDGRLPGAEDWFVVEMIPGAQPLDELAAGLLRVAVSPQTASGDAGSLAAQLAAGPDGLARTLAAVLPPDSGTELLLVIDQFEEVFTLVEDEAVRNTFLQALVTAVSAPGSRLRVVITLRADFYDRPLLHPELGSLVRACTEVVLPLTPDELREAVVAPAGRVGVRLEPELLAVIVQEVGEQPGALPLLQYALTELFEHRDGRTLTLGAYRAGGGVLGALARRADDIYAGLDPAEQEIARQLFLRLVTLGEGVEDTRRRVPRSELAALDTDSAALDTVLDAFGRYRLLTFDRDPISRAPTVEVAHEALIRTWRHLRTWLDTSRDDLRVQRQLATAAADWSQAGRDPSFLATGTRLGQFAALDNEAVRLALTGTERAYLDASLEADKAREAAEQEQQQRELAAAQALAAAEHQRATATAATNRLLRQRAVVLAFALVGTVLLAGLAVMLAGQANSNLKEADSLRLAGAARNLLNTNANAETAALLSIRALHTTYTGQADEVLQRASARITTRRLFAGHSGLVQAVAVTPDGTGLVTGSADGTARLWTLASGAPGRTFNVPGGGVQAVAVSPDGKWLLTGGKDGTARLWNLATGEPVRTFSGHTGAVNSVAFAPTGQQVLTGSADHTARLWDAQTGNAIRTFGGPDGQTDLVSSVAFTPDGQQLVTSSLDKTVRLWDAQTGQRVHTFGDGIHWPKAATVSPDGKSVFAATVGGGVLQWNRQTGDLIRNFGDNGEFTSVAVSPDGRVLLAGDPTGAAHSWDLHTGKDVQLFSGHTDAVISVALTPDSKALVTGSADHTARLWQLPLPPPDGGGGSTPGGPPGGPPVNSTPGAAGGAGAPPPAPPANGTPAATGGPPGAGTKIGGPAVLALSADGKSVLSSSGAGFATLWDWPADRPVRVSPRIVKGIGGLGFVPQGVLIIGLDGQAHLWNPQSGQEERTFSLAEAHTFERIAFARDGRTLLTGWSQPQVRAWDTQTGSVRQTFALSGTATIRSLALSPDGQTVAAGGSDNLVYLWDAAGGRLLRTLAGHSEMVEGVAFAPDGRTLLSGAADKAVRLWDVATGQALRTFTTSDKVHDLVFSADGQTFLAVGSTDTAEVWDLAAGRRLRTLVAPDGGRISAALFAPDGRTLITSTPDGQLHTWPRDADELIRQVCAQLVRDLTPDERALYNIKDSAPTCPAP
jgi:WD40 repeat protein/class 3 adenylate cyclase